MRKYARNPGLNYVCTLGEQSTQRFSLYQCIRTHLPVQLCVGANLFARFEANLAQGSRLDWNYETVEASLLSTMCYKPLTKLSTISRSQWQQTRV